MKRFKTTHGIATSALILSACGLLSFHSTAQAATPVSGNIGANAIEIDSSANLYPANTPNFNNGPILNPGANVD